MINCNTLQISLGWAGDQPWMNVTKTYTVCLIACGMCIIGMTIFIYDYYLLMLMCALFGIFFASNFSFTPTILVELIPLDRFTTAYGLILLCQGIGNLLGPPLAGLSMCSCSVLHSFISVCSSCIFILRICIGFINSWFQLLMICCGCKYFKA